LRLKYIQWNKVNEYKYKNALLWSERINVQRQKTKEEKIIEKDQ